MSELDTEQIEGPPQQIRLVEPTLWVTDAEMIRRIGVPEKVARVNLREFDTKPQLGFPQKSKVWGNRRYWPAVKAWFDRSYGLTMPRN
jgi:hypothetical protein